MITGEDLNLNHLKKFSLKFSQEVFCSKLLYGLVTRDFQEKSLSKFKLKATVIISSNLERQKISQNASLS